MSAHVPAPWSTAGMREELDALRAENARLREALEEAAMNLTQYAEHMRRKWDYAKADMADSDAGMARAALKGATS